MDASSRPCLDRAATSPDRAPPVTEGTSTQEPTRSSQGRPKLRAALCLVHERIQRQVRPLIAGHRNRRGLSMAPSTLGPPKASFLSSARLRRPTSRRRRCHLRVPRPLKVPTNANPAASKLPSLPVHLHLEATSACAGAHRRRPNRSSPWPRIQPSHCQLAVDHVRPDPAGSRPGEPPPRHARTQPLPLAGSSSPAVGCLPKVRLPRPVP